MNRYIVSSKSGIERAILTTVEYVGQFMNIGVVNATLLSGYPIHFEVGDYMMYRGERFTLTVLPTVKKVASNNLTYSMQFQDEFHKLAYCVFRDIVPDDNNLIYPSYRDVGFTGNVKYLTERIEANLDVMYPNVWTIDVNPNADLSISKNISVQNSNCWNALSLVKTEYGLNYYKDGYVIKVGYDEPVVDKVFQYGSKGGAFTIERSVQQDENIITKLSISGTSRNLDNAYPKLPEWTNSVLSPDFFFNPLALMIPEFKLDGKTDYVLAPDADIAKYGIREGSVVVEDIYPSITGYLNDDGKPIDEIEMVGVISNTSKTFEVWINNTDFKNSSGARLPLKEQMIPTKTKLVMTSGALQGFGFFVIQVNDEDKRAVKLTLERNTSKNTVAHEEEEFTVPNTALKMKKGDKFVFIDIFMPQSFIIQAEQRLKARGLELIKDMLTPDNSYAIDIDDIFMANNDMYNSLWAGQKLPLKDESLGIDERITISSITIKEGQSLIPSFKVVLSNKNEPSQKNVIQDQISKVEGTVTNNFQALENLNAGLSRKLDKTIWDRVWELVTYNVGDSHVLGRIPQVSKYGLTMYADQGYEGQDIDHEGLYDALPIDNLTIKRRADGVIYVDVDYIKSQLNN